jgi:hypothetical protein
VLRRAFWLTVGLGAGATTAFMVARWTKRQRERLAPANLAKQAGEHASALGSRLAGGVKEFRTAYEEREAELRASMEDRPLGEDAAGPDRRTKP